MATRSDKMAAKELCNRYFVWIADGKDGMFVSGPFGHVAGDAEAHVTKEWDDIVSDAPEGAWGFVCHWVDGDYSEGGHAAYLERDHWVTEDNQSLAAEYDAEDIISRHMAPERAASKAMRDWMERRTKACESGNIPCYCGELETLVAAYDAAVEER